MAKLNQSLDVLSLLWDSKPQKPPLLQRWFLIEIILADHVAQNWNTILPSLLAMYRKLHELGMEVEFNSTQIQNSPRAQHTPSRPVLHSG